MKELINLAEKEYIASLQRKGQVLEDLLNKINECSQILEKYTKFDTVSGVFDLKFEEDRVYIEEGDVLGGKDIYNHLFGYNKAIFFIVTLGAEIDRQINLLQYKDLSLSYILDELASILVDIKSQKIEDVIRDNCDNSIRYSCGYGDYSIAYQTNICNLLKSEKIGVLITNGGMLKPTKTISAVIGIKEKI